MDNRNDSVIKSDLRSDFERHFRFYQSHHRTVGCKATHMVGIPLIVLSLFIFPFNKKTAAKLQAGGLVLQFIGHYVFEHNQPVLLEMRDPMTLCAALFFVFKHWQKFLQGDSASSARVQTKL